MLRSIKRSLSGGNLATPRVRFAAESKPPASQGGSTVSMEGDTLEASTMGGDTISSDSSEDSMFGPLFGDEEEPPGCTKGDAVDFVGVATESFRALAMSAWLVSETMSAIGSELVRMPHHCGFNNAQDTDTRVYATSEGSRGLFGGGRKKGGGDDSSSVASYPPSKQKRRKRPFGFFGLSNRAKKYQNESGLPTTVTTTNAPPPPALLRKVPPKKPATPKSLVCAPKYDSKLDDTNTIITSKTSDSKPARAKKLLTACFVKKPHLDHDDDTAMQSRYRLDQEDLELVGTSTVYTIRMSRVPTAEYDDHL